ncbi:hypothetical protein K488DRAFT_85919 [Vararia minispora EC-137]|uniref:Uncharacterized protein n=1 Tax=Vararia minispora EC-137 TaxID=1314806 RepID=A0ACB8QM02_9AGAM|nr:hypothetical protein K488DRAFT_85919 [Vararia minispora EC-137]
MISPSIHRRVASGSAALYDPEDLAAYLLSEHAVPGWSCSERNHALVSRLLELGLEFAADGRGHELAETARQVIVELTNVDSSLGRAVQDGLEKGTIDLVNVALGAEPPSMAALMLMGHLFALGLLDVDCVQQTMYTITRAPPSSTGLQALNTLLYSSGHILCDRVHGEWMKGIALALNERNEKGRYIWAAGENETDCVSNSIATIWSWLKASHPSCAAMGHAKDRPGLLFEFAHWQFNHSTGFINGYSHTKPSVMPALTYPPRHKTDQCPVVRAGKKRYHRGRAVDCPLFFAVWRKKIAEQKARAQREEVARYTRRKEMKVAKKGVVIFQIGLAAQRLR